MYHRLSFATLSVLVLSFASDGVANDWPSQLFCAHGHSACAADCCVAEGCPADDSDPPCGCDNDETDCRIFSNCWTECRNITIAGWLSQGFTWNPDNPPDRLNGPVDFNDRSNAYLLNQIYLYVEKEIDEDAGGWDLGYRADMIYGTDARFATALGLDIKLVGSLYGLAIPQFYLDLYVPVGEGFTFRLGHFYGLLGYENNTAVDNRFYSTSYSNVSTASTQTGMLVTYGVSDQLSLTGGFTRGWDNFADNNRQLSFLGGLTLTSSDEETELALALSVGNERDRLAAPGDPGGMRIAYSLVLTHQLNDNLVYVLENYVGYEKDGAAGPGGVGSQNAEWYGVNQYLYYDINPCWRAAARFEWFRDDDDVTDLGGAGNYYELTFGLNWQPTQCVIVRPELRWDWYAGGALPFNAGTAVDQFLFAFDVIVRF